MTRLTERRIGARHDAAMGAELERLHQQQAAEERCGCGGLLAVPYDCVCDEDEAGELAEVVDV